MFSLERNLLNVTEYSPAKTGEHSSDIPQFLKPRVLQKYLAYNKHNMLYLARKCARIFVVGHYLSLKDHSSRFSEQTQISERISAQNGDYCQYIRR